MFVSKFSIKFQNTINLQIILNLLVIMIIIWYFTFIISLFKKHQLLFIIKGKNKNNKINLPISLGVTFFNINEYFSNEYFLSIFLIIVLLNCQVVLGLGRASLYLQEKMTLSFFFAIMLLISGWFKIIGTFNKR